MHEDNTFDQIRSFPEDVQREIIREAEARLQAQLVVSMAADQRALTLAGFQIASVTAALGGGMVLVFNGKMPELLLAVSIFIVSFLVSAFKSIDSVRPSEFCFPGNRPGNWLPDQWEGYKTHDLDMVQARVEQSKHLNKMILENAESAMRSAKSVQFSIDIMFWSTVLSAIITLLILLCYAFDNG